MKVTTIAIKKRAFHDSIRQEELERMFSKIRMEMIDHLQQGEESLDLNEVFKGLPKTLLELNDKVPYVGEGQSLLLEALIDRAEQVIGRMGGLNLREWGAGMQILIKMLDYCQKTNCKKNIVQLSQHSLISQGFQKLQQNKILKLDILLLVLDYYIACLKWPSVLPAQIKYLRQLLHQFYFNISSEKASEYMKYVGFMNLVVDRFLQEDRMDIIMELFVVDTQLLVNLTSLVVELYRKQFRTYSQSLICSLMKLFINLTYALHQTKLNQVFMLSSFRELVINKLNNPDKTTAYFMQLAINLMVDEPSAQQIISQRVNLHNLSKSQFAKFNQVYLQDIRLLCQQR